MREFFIAKGWEDKGINLPSRATQYSAGYDFEAAEDIVIPGLCSRIASLLNGYIKLDLDLSFLKPTLVPTGIKVKMEKDEVLLLFNRSGNPLKKLLLLSNGVGVIDSDYFENIDNDGHIYFAFWRLAFNNLTIKKGERIGQGVFTKFLLTNTDSSTDKKQRNGGLGHTN